MPSLDAYPSHITTKVLLIGDSGTGKTGATLALARAGYNLRFLDFDAGLDILKGMILGDRSLSDAERKALFGRIAYETFTDRMKTLAGKVFPVEATAWTRAMKLLDDWPPFGPLPTWTPQDVLVVDSLTFAGKSAMRFIQNMNGRLATVPQWSDYFGAQQLLESFVAMLYSDSIKCNVVVLSHVREVGKKQTIVDDKGRQMTIEEPDTKRGYAETGTGNALSPNIGRYFNGVLLADIVGSGQSTKRIIRTVPHENIGLKNPAPLTLKPEYPLATGLADYFSAVRGSPSVGDATQVKVG